RIQKGRATHQRPVRAAVRAAIQTTSPTRQAIAGSGSVHDCRVCTIKSDLIQEVVRNTRAAGHPSGSAVSAFVDGFPSERSCENDRRVCWMNRNRSDVSGRQSRRISGNDTLPKICAAVRAFEKRIAASLCGLKGRARRGKVERMRSASDIGIAAYVDSDRVGEVTVIATEVTGINNRITCGIELHYESIGN